MRVEQGKVGMASCVGITRKGHYPRNKVVAQKVWPFPYCLQGLRTPIRESHSLLVSDQASISDSKQIYTHPMEIATQKLCDQPLESTAAGRKMHNNPTSTIITLHPTSTNCKSRLLEVCELFG